MLNAHLTHYEDIFQNLEWRYDIRICNFHHFVHELIAYD
jgi:hypothetical protein